MSNFLNGLENQSNRTVTENGADALLSTRSGLLDLFAVAGALRGRSDTEIIKKFVDAMAEDQLLAMKLLFYARDIRGGLGERDFFKIIAKYLANGHEDLIKRNLEIIPEYGRWDDLLVLLDTPLEKNVLELIARQLSSDMRTDTPSLLAKWLPSINTSSKKTVAKARVIKNYLGVTEKAYRQMLSKLRAKLKIIETQISNGEWDNIEYSKIPSKAMTNYRKAFWRHSPEKFESFLNKVEKGEVEIKSNTLYPYDIIEKMIPYGIERGRFVEDRALEAQWKALPDYMDGDEHNILVVADTSASMTGRPMATALGLGIYFAERNKGDYKDKMITFSSNARYIKLTAERLSDKLRQVPAIVQNTNLESVFDLVLSTAVNNNIPQEDIPKALIIISDMEMDRQCDQFSWNYSGKADNSVFNTFYDKMEIKYNNYGYNMPNIVWWNVDSRSDNYQVDYERRGTQLVSGQSQSTFKHVINNIGKTPYEGMLDVLNSERYSQVK